MNNNRRWLLIEIIAKYIITPKSSSRSFIKIDLILQNGRHIMSFQINAVACISYNESQTWLTLDSL